MGPEPAPAPGPDLSLGAVPPGVTVVGGGDGVTVEEVDGELLVNGTPLSECEES